MPTRSKPFGTRPDEADDAEVARFSTTSSASTIPSADIRHWVLEDETGVIYLIVWSTASKRYLNPLLQAQLLEVGGKLQHASGVTHVIAEDLFDRTAWLGSMRTIARNFR